MPSGRVILIKPTLIISHSRFTMRLWMICWDIYYVIHKYDTVESVIQIDVDDERNRDDNDNDVKTTDMVAQMTTVTPTCDLDYYTQSPTTADRAAFHIGTVGGKIIVV